MKKILLILVAMGLTLGMAQAQSPLFTCDFHDGTDSNGVFTGTGYITGIIDTGTEAHAQTAAFSKWHHWPNLDQSTLTGTDSNTMQSVYPFIFQSYGGASTILNLCDSAHTSTGNGFMMMSMLDQQAIHSTGNFNAYIQLGPIDASSAPVVAVQFFQSYRKLRDHCYLDYSTDGATWNETEINLMGTNGTAQGVVSYTLPYDAAGQSSLMIRLRYKGLDTVAPPYGYYWIIDDISVSSSQLPDYTVTVNSNDSSMGTVSGGGVYPMGSTATLTAFPLEEWCHFEEWQDHSTENPRRITVTKDTVFTAFFVPNAERYTIHAGVNNSTMGYVTGGGTYNVGAIATLTAFPNEGYVFVRWNDSITDNPYRFRVTSDARYTAYFRSTNRIAEAGDRLALSLSPNPTSGEVTVVLPAMGDGAMLTVADATGREVRRQSIAPAAETSRLRLDLKGLPAGAYFVTVATPQGSHTEKLVIGEF